MRLELFPFRYRDPLTGKWRRARYVAALDEIARRFVDFEIIGPPEIRDVRQDARCFSPHYKLMTHAELRRVSELPIELHPHLAKPPAIDTLEAFLVRLFLRRYVTFCARRHRFAAMSGTALLFAEVGASVA